MSSSEQSSSNRYGSLQEKCEVFAQAWTQYFDQGGGGCPSIESYLEDVQEPARSQLFRELLLIERSTRRQMGDDTDSEDYLRRFPQYRTLIEGLDNDLEVSDDRTHDSCESGEEDITAEEWPEIIGRYKIIGQIGSGAFGYVLHGYDPHLDRDVAIKLPHWKRIQSEVHAARFIREARILASLDHPNLLPVYDAGRLEDGRCFLVSKRIDGENLADHLKQNRLQYDAIVRLIASVADGLNEAHAHRIVHRDVKPANILLATNGRAYLADFGLALSDEDYGDSNSRGLTPAYASPEQARGEGHLVDGRSDIFALGVVTYQLLTGVRPFVGNANSSVLTQIVTVEPRPLRQLDLQIPRELERICLKALSKRAIDRYQTCHDLADDLRHFLDSTVIAADVSTLAEPRHSAEQRDGTRGDEERPVVPRGLRSFEEEDAEFFLELLPGPRDREGLPEAIAFWKRRIESEEPERMFRVGMIYGPSGCGKSSLVKAGLIPRLSENIEHVFIECTADDTEARLLNYLKTRFESAADCSSLPDAMAALRRHPASRGKVLIIVDQFEQWLHSHRQSGDSTLVRALRQCDGRASQAIILLRDEFWMPATRFMRQLELPIRQGENVAAVDLFDRQHARNVLTRFGQAYGRLPRRTDEISADQDEFLEQVIDDLADDSDRVISVRLSLLADMVKGKPWSPKTFRQIGGGHGVGLTFLKETFSARNASPRYRLHQRAAAAVLRATLPDDGIDIRGGICAEPTLLAASGYSIGAEFQELMEILNTETRLLTPVDPEGAVIIREPSSSDAPPSSDSALKHYQLTHDYLVPSIRQWLALEDQNTRSGRARRRLADRTAAWQLRSESRQLPSLWETLNIRLFTRPKFWSTDERRMVHRATVHHAMRLGTICCVLVVCSLLALSVRRQIVADELVNGLLRADLVEAVNFSQDLDRYRSRVEPLLEDQFDGLDASKKLRASLAMLRWHQTDEYRKPPIEQLRDQASPDEVVVIARHFRDHDSQIQQQLWPLLDRSDSSYDATSLRVASALAVLNPDSSDWTAPRCRHVAHQLALAPTSELALWMTNLWELRQKLVPPLSEIYGSGHEDERIGTTQIAHAADVLAVYAVDQPEYLVRAISFARNSAEFGTLVGSLELQGDAGQRALQSWLAQSTELQDDELKGDELQDDAEIERAMRSRCNAAIAWLLVSDGGGVWRELQYAGDPRLRSMMIHQFRPFAVAPQKLLAQLLVERDVGVRAALIESLGQYTPDELTELERQRLIQFVLDAYERDDDPAIHGVARWLLIRWQLADAVHRADQSAQPVRSSETMKLSNRGLGWYLNGEGQTMIVIRGPNEFTMGSPEDEPGRDQAERQHTVRIERAFALSACEVTQRQYERFSVEVLKRKIDDYLEQRFPDVDCPIGAVDWHRAAAYCNWLSQREEIEPDQWCYVQEPDGTIRTVPDYLHRTGYRLPTEAEWEFACRAWTTTSRYFGSTEQLLPSYGWYLDNAGGRAWAVGLLKPNAFGIFDMFGNVSEWCHDAYDRYPEESSIDVERSDDDETVRQPRVIRGGAFDFQARILRSANRERKTPRMVEWYYGFRVARTISK